MTSFLRAVLLGLCICAFLILGDVLAMMAADWSREIFDFNPTCIYENWYDFVNGDFSDYLYAMSWVNLVLAVLLYAAIIVAALMKKNLVVYCVLCIYIIAWIVWAVLLIYILLFFSYIYFEETRLVMSCGGLGEVRNIWWCSAGALSMVLFAAIGGCCFGCTKTTS
eukprot:129595_1